MELLRQCLEEKSFKLVLPGLFEEAQVGHTLSWPQKQWSPGPTLKGAHQCKSIRADERQGIWVKARQDVPESPETRHWHVSMKQSRSQKKAGCSETPLTKPWVSFSIHFVSHSPPWLMRPPTLVSLEMTLMLGKIEGRRRMG